MILKNLVCESPSRLDHLRIQVFSSGNWTGSCHLEDISPLIPKSVCCSELNRRNDAGKRSNVADGKKRYSPVTEHFYYLRTVLNLCRSN